MQEFGTVLLPGTEADPAGAAVTCRRFASCFTFPQSARGDPRGVCPRSLRTLVPPERLAWTASRGEGAGDTLQSWCCWKSRLSVCLPTPWPQLAFGDSVYSLLIC